jgi:hypothetical protein
LRTFARGIFAAWVSSALKPDRHCAGKETKVLRS